jgi:hypothetical protein
LSIAVDSSGWVAAAFDDGSIGLWTTMGAKQWIRRDSDAPRSFAFGNRERRLVGTDGFSVCSWDIEDGRRQTRFLMPRRIYSSSACKFAPLVAVRALDSVMVVNFETGSIESEFEASVGLPVLEFHPSKELIAVTDAHGVSVVDYDGRMHSSFRLPEETVLSLAWNASGTRLCLGTAEGAPREFSLHTE